MQIDGGENTYSGRVYLSRDEWEEINRINEAWRFFRNSIGYAPPNGMTLAKIQEIKKLVGGEND
jgi:hypothetical protein